MRNVQLSIMLILVIGPFTLPLTGQEAITSEGQTLPDSARPAEPFELGITVSDSPGMGVRINGVLWGTPADRAGIRSGDYLMSVSGKPITRPQDLMAAVRSAAGDKSLIVGIWRNGDLLNRTIRLDSKFSDDVREKAWLGVMLRTDGGKVLIADVLPASPAEAGGLQIGDTVTRMDARKIDSAEGLVKLMERIKAGENIEVTVLRNGQERTFTIRVGSVMQRAMNWWENQFPLDRIPGRWSEFADVDPDDLESFDGMIDRLRQEMQALREEVRRLRGQDNDEKDANAADQPQAEEGSSFNERRESAASSETAIVPAAFTGDNAVRYPVGTYARYRGVPPQVQYRYGYPTASARGAYRSPRYFYYSGPRYYYPGLVYPRTPSTMRYGPRVSVYVGPGVFWY